MIDNKKVSGSNDGKDCRAVSKVSQTSKFIANL